MKYNIRGDKLEVTDAIGNYVESKLDRLNKYFKEDEILANVLLKVRGNDQIIEVTIPTDKFILRSEEADKDLYAAIDLVLDKLERQIRKNKTKLNDRYKKENIVDFNFEFIEEVEEDVEDNLIVKRKLLYDYIKREKKENIFNNENKLSRKLNRMNKINNNNDNNNIKNNYSFILISNKIFGNENSFLINKNNNNNKEKKKNLVLNKRNKINFRNKSSITLNNFSKYLNNNNFSLLKTKF